MVDLEELNAEFQAALDNIDVESKRNKKGETNMFLKMSMLLVILILAVGCGFFPAPDKPDGPSICKVGQKVEFETEGTDPIDVHLFKWDFGDGEISDWDNDNEQIKHRFSQKGKFSVRAKERCPLWVFWSGWSDERKVTVK